MKFKKPDKKWSLAPSQERHASKCAQTEIVDKGIFV